MVGDDEVLLLNLNMQEHASERYLMDNTGGLEYDWPPIIDLKDNQIDPRLPISANLPYTPSQAINTIVVDNVIILVKEKHDPLQVHLLEKD